MEIIVGIGIIWLLAHLYGKYKQRVRDAAAREVLSGFSFEREVQSIKAIIENEGFTDERRAFLEKKRAQTQSNDGYCPVCDKMSMVVRAGKYGEFLGCRNYPKCTYTKDY